MRRTRGHQGQGEGSTKVDQGALRVQAERLESVEEQGDVGSLLASQLISIGLDSSAEGSLLAACTYIMLTPLKCRTVLWLAYPTWAAGNKPVNSPPDDGFPVC